MHREWNPDESAFSPPKVAGVTLLTLAVFVLIGLDLYPLLFGTGTPAERSYMGYRFALIAAVLGGARTVYSAIDKLFQGKLGADLAVAIACLAAILMNEPLVAAEVIAIGLFGELLEAFAFGRAQGGLRKLLEVFPRRVWLLRDGREERVEADTLVVGDRVAVKPGGKIPVDGLIESGRASIDAAALTGESLPVELGPGDRVRAGCVNLDGQLIILAERVREETVAGRVLTLTAQAIRDRGEADRRVDRYARWFLPIVLGLALVTLAFNLFVQLGPFKPPEARPSFAAGFRAALYPTLGVLVVACPCALILATPAALMAALGRLAGTGIVVRSGAALERLADIELVAFDKTGTLTHGRLNFEAISPDDPEAFRAAAALSANSEHPISRALVEEAARRNVGITAADNFRSTAGGGVSATIDGRQWHLGNAGYLRTIGVESTESFEDESGRAVTYIADADGVRATITLADRVRDDALACVAALRSAGVGRVAMLSGDRRSSAERIASEVGIEEVAAPLLPAAKAEWLRDSGITSERVAFVGDGINDAPALASAGVGIAVGSGSEAATEAGQIVLMGPPLKSFPLLFRLAKEIREITRQNILYFAFGVNIVGVILTGILWPLFSPSAKWLEAAPLAGVLYHQIGSVAVLINAMRLLAFERESTKRTRRRLSDAGERLDAFAARWLDFDNLLHGMAHRWRLTLTIFGSACVAIWLGSGFVAVGPNEAGVARRFGRVDGVLAPGLHWLWPAPVSRVTLVDVGSPRLVEIGYRRPDGANNPVPAGGWAQPHDGGRRLPEESMMLTGDGSLVEIRATVRLRTSDPVAYVLAADAPESLARAEAEAVLREFVASESIFELLTARRSAFEVAAADELSRRLGDKFGVELAEMTVHDLHPPPEVIAAFHEVAQAIQDRDRRIHEAEARALRRRRSADERSTRTRSEAESIADERLQQASSRADVFLAWLKDRSELGDEAERELSGLPEGPERSKARAEKIESRRTLGEYALTWAALTEVLRCRDKVFIDSEGVPGRRSLWLIDPEFGRPPAASPPKIQKEDG